MVGMSSLSFVERGGIGIGVGVGIWVGIGVGNRIGVRIGIDLVVGWMGV